MPRFMKKPVVVEAKKYDGTYDSAMRMIRWGKAHGVLLQRATLPTYPPEVTIAISTLEGTMQARQGDWIIKGVRGEFYPCKPDIFEATYELVADLKED